MSDTQRKIPKKYAIPLFITALILLLCAGLAVYKTIAEADEQYYSIAEGDVELVAVSPCGESGIATDSKIVLEWNRPIDESVCEKVELSPSARGNWFVYGNYLIFEPRSLAAGTYYTVTIPAGTVLVKGETPLTEDLFFAFETENSALRFPQTEALTLSQRSYTAAEGEDISIPVSYFAADDENKLQVTVYQTADSERYINALAQLFAYPQWAELSIAGFKADTKGFKEVIQIETEVSAEHTLSLGELSQGQYLVRISGENCSRDFALTVGNSDYDQTYDSNQMLLWCHENGEPLADAEVTCGNTAARTDSNGFAVIDTALTPKSVAENPALLSAVIDDDVTETVIFLTADDISAAYCGTVAVNRSQYQKGEDITVSGALFTKMGAPVNGEAEIRITSELNTVTKVKVTVEDGYFHYQWDNLSLIDGTYGVSLYYQQKEQAKDSFTVTSQQNELLLIVEADKTELTAGQTVRYTAAVYHGDGTPVTEGKVLLNGEDAAKLNQNGIATFQKSYPAASEGVIKTAEFTVDSPYGEAEPVTVNVTISDRQNNLTELVPEAITGETISLGYLDGSYSVVDNDTAAVGFWNYNNGAYKTDFDNSANRITGPGQITAAVGENICADFDYQGETCRFAVISLCAGVLPDSLRGQTLYGEAYAELPSGTFAANAVFTEGEPLSVSFSPLNYRGDYYLRAWCETAGGNTLSYYVPVTVKGAVLFADVAQCYRPGKTVTLNFGLKADESADYEYSLVLGDEVYTGTAGSDFNVDIGTLEKGFYAGEITVSAQGVAVASRTFDFTVSGKQPVAYEVQEGISAEAVKVYQVKEADAAAVKVMCEANAVPGEQIFCQLQNAFAERYWGADFSAFTTIDDILNSYQNEDGGFSRQPGGSDDLLLSALVAEQSCLSYDTDSLGAFLRYQLKHADNPETAALACWGLSCLGVDCTGSLALIDDSKHSTQRTELYLAESFYAAGNRSEAEKIYRSLLGDVDEADDGCYLKADNEQEIAFATAMLLDLAVKLNAEEADDFMAYLLNTDIQYQTGRYLLVKNILKTVAAAEVISADSKAEDGYVYYSLISADLSDVPELSCEITVGGEKVGKLKKDEIAAFTLHWEKTDNHLYQVCLVVDSTCRLLPITENCGCCGDYRQLTDGDSFTVSFRCEKAGEGHFLKAYVIDLTTGEIIGWANPEGKVIS